MAATSKLSFEPSQIAVFGLGYVGCVTAACLAHLGHDVIGVDKDDFKVQSVLDSRAPFFEPGLVELIREGVSAGRLSATTVATEALEQARIAFICVGTPSERNGNIGVEQLRRVSEEIGRALGDRHPRPNGPLIVAVRSTVFPGTSEEVVVPAVAPAGAVVVVNPEFLREGSAVRDFLQPSLIVVGGSDPDVTKQVAALYAPLGVDASLVSLRTGEMIKYACNAFHATKIAFANEVGTVAHELGIDGREVMDTLCRDLTLNISTAYLKPGFAFGGSCLPKDLRALVYRARRLDLKLSLLESILPSNDEHLKRATQTVLDLPAERLGVFGLTFKENTDDLRESPVVALLEQLIGKGRDVRVFDPHVQLNLIYGSNESFLLAAIPHISRLLDATLNQTLSWADHLVLAQKPADGAAERIRRSGLPVLDLVGSKLIGS